jgi:hypothetical protein
MKKWYVFDQFDTYFSFNTPQDAAKEAADLADQGLTGIHITHMTEAQYDAYCANSDLNAALKL